MKTRSTRDVPSLNHTGRLVGYAAKYNVLSEVLYDETIVPSGPFRERLRPGCFDACLAGNPDVRALFNHNKDAVIGRTKNGTLTLASDETGLYFECIPPDTMYGRDALALVEAGYVDGCSFGFYPIEYEETAETDDDGNPVIDLVTADVFEITPVCSFPAYLDTTVEVRTKPDDEAERRRARARTLRARLRFAASLEG